ncbi:MAG: ATP-dependent metallopeptidase FtsH/Yme1/Tma family protein, partial [Myxococcales bacterium]|nr:ATP-dependent metallopeptidase FtsH/Yme1/Tma family protein [Myxococcales bacterium]
MIALLVLAFAMLLSTFSNRGTQVIAYSEMKDHIRQGEVSEVVLTASHVEARPQGEVAPEGVRVWRA